MTEAEANWLAEYVATEANERGSLHESHASSRPLSVEYECVGLAGEFEFGANVGQMPDLERRPNGDKGIDFMVPVLMSVDVKTARKAGHLIHEQGKPFADLYVLAEFDDVHRRATLLGWCHGKALQAAPVRDFGYGILSHHIHRGALRPMSELLARVMRFVPR